MTGFEWTVVILLVLILLKPAGRHGMHESRQQELMRSLAAAEDHLRLIRNDLENLQSSVSQIESCAISADLRALPERQDPWPDGPFGKP